MRPGIVIGSYAASHWLKGYRQPKDIDIVAHDNEIEAFIGTFQDRMEKVSVVGGVVSCKMPDGTFFEFRRVELGKVNPMIYDLGAGGPAVKIQHGGIDFDLRVPDLDLLFSLKRSHLHHPIHWQKNVADYHLMRSNGAKLLPDLYLAARQEVDQRMKARMPNLKLENSAFFKQAETGAPHIIDHDDLHWMVAYGDRPVFVDLKDDQSQAWCSPDKFAALPKKRRLECIREETMVIALERFLLPGTLANQDEAYAKALEKVSTRLMGGSFREFAIEHWPALKDRDVDLEPIMQECLARNAAASPRAA